MEQIKAQVISGGDLKEGDLLPSVRAMAKELKISALTVKKAYDNLEEEEMTSNRCMGKARMSTASNKELMLEERRREDRSGSRSCSDRKARGCELE